MFYCNLLSSCSFFQLFQVLDNIQGMVTLQIGSVISEVGGEQDMNFEQRKVQLVYEGQFGIAHRRKTHWDGARTTFAFLLALYFDRAHLLLRLSHAVEDSACKDYYAGID